MDIFIVGMVSILAIGIGIVGLVSPARQVAFVSHWKSSAGLWASAGIRLAFGITLWSVAPATRTPVVLQGLAVLSVAAARRLPCPGLGAIAVAPGGVVPATAGGDSDRGVGSGGAWSLYPGVSARLNRSASSGITIGLQPATRQTLSLTGWLLRWRFEASPS